MPVAHRLAHGDDVGLNAKGLKAPHMGSGTPEPHLHLIGYGEGSGTVRSGISTRQVSSWRHQRSVSVEDAVDQQRRSALAGAGKISSGLGDIGRVFLACIFGALPMKAAIEVGRRHGRHPIWL